MSDLIRREDAIEALYQPIQTTLPSTFAESTSLVITMANNLPSAEPERKKSEWVKVGHWGRFYKCNQCGNYLDFDGVNAGRGDANFCPNCGADMRGDR